VGIGADQLGQHPAFTFSITSFDPWVNQRSVQQEGLLAEVAAVKKLWSWPPSLIGLCDRVCPLIVRFFLHSCLLGLTHEVADRKKAWSVVSVVELFALVCVPFKKRLYLR
jgi:hypothetical protein